MLVTGVGTLGILDDMTTCAHADWQLWQTHGFAVAIVVS